MQYNLTGQKTVQLSIDQFLVFRTRPASLVDFRILFFQIAVVCLGNFYANFVESGNNEIGLNLIHGFEGTGYCCQSEEGILLEVELPHDHRLDIESAFNLVIRNESKDTIRFRNPNSRKGFYSVSFQFIDLTTKEAFNVKRREITAERSWEGIRAKFNTELPIIEVAPGNSWRMPIQFDIFVNRLWEGLPNLNTKREFLFSATLNLKDIEETEPDLIAAKSISSQQIKVVLTSDSLKTPFDYLKKNRPGSAFETIKSNREWTSKRNGTGQTLLHLAARFGHAEVARWLVENDADVNSRDAAGIAPLHVAFNKDVVEIILSKKPNLELKWLGKTIIQIAADKFIQAKSESARQRWREIVKAYQGAGAEYDIETATKMGDLAHIKNLNLNSLSKTDARKVLRISAEIGHVDICRCIIENCRIEVPELAKKDAFSIMQGAVAYPDVVRLLVEHGIGINAKLPKQNVPGWQLMFGEGATLLHFAAANGDPETISILLDSGIDIFALATCSQYKGMKMSAIEVAAGNGRANNLKKLLRHPKFLGGDPQLKQAELDMSLFWGYQYPRVVECLILFDANVNFSPSGMTVIQAATNEFLSEFDNQEIAVRLVESISLLQKAGADGGLLSAIAIGDKKRIAELLEPDPKIANEVGKTKYPALHFAVKFNYPDVVETILGQGVDVDVRNGSDDTGRMYRTALHVASSLDRKEMAKILLRAGADVNAIDENSQTPLHVAVEEGSPQVARILIENGADIDKKDRYGKTPWDIHFNQSFLLRSQFKELLGKMINSDD